MRIVSLRLPFVVLESWHRWKPSRVHRAVGGCLENRVAFGVGGSRKRGCHNSALEKFPVRMLLELFCHTDEIEDVVFRQVSNGYKIMSLT